MSTSIKALDFSTSWFPNIPYKVYLRSSPGILRFNKCHRTFLMLGECSLLDYGVWTPSILPPHLVTADRPATTLDEVDPSDVRPVPTAHDTRRPLHSPSREGCTQGGPHRDPHPPFSRERQKLKVTDNDDERSFLPSPIRGPRWEKRQSTFWS